MKEIRRQDEISFQLPGAQALVQVSAQLIERLILRTYFLQHKLAETATGLLICTVAPVSCLVALQCRLQLSIHDAGLVHHGNSHWWRLNANNDRRHDHEQRHDDRQQNRRDDEHLRAHALHIFPFDYRQKLSHAASVTFVMKMSLRLGSIISNLPITAPASISRRSSVCTSAPAARRACASSAWRTTLLTNTGSSSTPSP